MAFPALLSTWSYKRYDFWKKKRKLLNKKCISSFSINFVWKIFHSKKKWASYDKKNIYIGLRVKYPLFLSDFNETWISRQIFEKYSNMKFRKNPSSGSRVVSCGRTDMAWQVVTFRNFVNASKIARLIRVSRTQRLRTRLTVTSYILSYLFCLFLWIKATSFTRFDVAFSRQCPWKVLSFDM